MKIVLRLVLVAVREHRGHSIPRSELFRGASTLKYTCRLRHTACLLEDSMTSEATRSFH